MEEIKAPKGKFRVLGVNTSNMDCWVIGDFDDDQMSIAVKTANGKSGKTIKTYVYDDKGRRIHESTNEI